MSTDYVMRDLYQRLTLSPEADVQAIQLAIEHCPNSTLRQDATATLTIAERKHIYDSLHGTVSDIGRLRARLGLTHGAHWQEDVANDFSLPPDHAISRHDELMNRVSHAVSLYNRRRHWRGPWLFITLFAGGTAIGLAVGFALSLRLGMG